MLMKVTTIILMDILVHPSTKNQTDLEIWEWVVNRKKYRIFEHSEEMMMDILNQINIQPA